MEKVDDNLVNLYSLIPVLPGNGQHFLLRTVTELALPQSHQAVRKHGRTACHSGIAGQDFFRVFLSADPVIHLSGTPGDPLCQIVCKGNPADRRIIP